MRSTAAAAALFLLGSCSLLAGCHSYRIDATVENRTGAAIELLEVDYPSASFGADALAAGADYHYRFQVRLSGPIKVQYTETGTHRVRQLSGPPLFEGQEGRIEIVLLPDGKASFHTELNPHH
ncbi:MAG TPA: hypothetical protein VL967_10540 [Terracidiphilus sp.]|nr:hypothetical protein [Terracidiphilus sp.]